MKPKPILLLSVNGDPHGRGYVASESTDGGDSWFYRGDLGARSRAWWRAYARANDYTLRIEG
jgi:hypothetical protein